MSSQAEVDIRGVRHGEYTLLVCSACGPVAVTTLPLFSAIAFHKDEHENERSNR